MADETTDTPIIEVTDEENAQAVLEYLKEHQEEQKQPVVSSPPEYKEVDTVETPDFNMSFSADPVFATNEKEKEVETYFIPVADKEVPITDEDQALYLKAMLNDKNVHLTQTMCGGQVRIECRALSVYELDMALLAAVAMSGGALDKPSPLLPSCMQQVRVAMQVVRINDTPQNAIELTPNRKNQKEEVEKLVERVDAALTRMNAGKYGMMLRALNVFEHKLSRLNALAYTGNFWKPVEIG